MPTPRLPTPGGDDNVWGDVLNEFLQVEHNADGTLKDALRQAKLSALSTAEVATKTANYTAVAGDLVPVNTTSGPLTITLPAATNGILVGVRWESGTNPVTITAAGTDKIGSGVATTVTDLAQGESRIWRAVPAGGRWQVVGGWKPQVSVLLIDNAGALPAGTPAGTVVVVKA